jgi:hypothetical protein
MRRIVRPPRLNEVSQQQAAIHESSSARLNLPVPQLCSSSDSALGNPCVVQKCLTSRSSNDLSLAQLVSATERITELISATAITHAAPGDISVRNQTSTTSEPARINNTSVRREELAHSYHKPSSIILHSNARRGAGSRLPRATPPNTLQSPRLWAAMDIPRVLVRVLS